MNQFYLNLISHRLAMRACRCQRLVLDKASAKRLQQGFSLLELVVVVALLSIVALASTSLLIDNGDLKRQEATEKRWDQIHDAIISQPNLYLNGSPYIRGYVADMGRLPVSIYELISLNATIDHDDNVATPEIPLTYDHDDNDATPEIPLTYDDDGDGDDPAPTAEIVMGQPAWGEVQLDPNYTVDPLGNFINTISGGWRGPYLYTAGSRQFRDGWGREDNDLGRDFFNYGWEVDTNGAPITEVLDLFIQSFGSDQDQFGTGDFTEDFPVDAGQAIVSENEWMLSAAPITFNINFSNAIRDAAVGINPVTLPTVPPLPAVGWVPQELELRIYRYVDNGDNVVDDNDLLPVNADATFTVTDGASAASTTITPEEADFAAVPPVRGMPIGRYAALIWCTNNNNYPVPPALPVIADDTVYDGDCDGGNVDHSPVYFTLTNNTSQVTLTWDLP